MPICADCGGSQPDDNLLAMHRSRYCPARGKSTVAVATPALNGTGPHQPELVSDTAAASVGISYPALDQNFVLDVELGRTIKDLMVLSETSPQNLLLVGPQGSGKTSLAKQIAAAYRRPLAMLSMGKLQEPSQLFGERLYNPAQGTYYQRALFWRAIETDGCIVVTDEINRVENPKCLNPLSNLLDDLRETWVDELETLLRVAPRVVFIATMNEGLEYSGVDPLDIALRSRFYRIDLAYPLRNISVGVLVAKTGITDTQATVLMEIVSPGSERGAAMRSLIQAAQLIKLGASYRRAILAAFSDMEKRDMEQVLIRAAAHDQTYAVQEVWASWP